MSVPVGDSSPRSGWRTRLTSAHGFATVLMSLTVTLIVLVAVVYLYAPRSQSVPPGASQHQASQQVAQASQQMPPASQQISQPSAGQMPEAVNGKPVLQPSQLSPADLAEPGRSLLLGGYLVFDVPTCTTPNDRKPAQCSGLSLWSDSVPDNYADDAPVPLFPSDALAAALPKPGVAQWPAPIVLQAHVPGDDSCSMASEYDCSTGVEPDAILWQGEPVTVPPTGYDDPVTVKAGPLSLSSGEGWTATQQPEGSWSIVATFVDEVPAQTTFVMSEANDIDVSTPLAISDHYPNAHNVQYGQADPPAWIAQIGSGQTRESVLGAVVGDVTYEFDLDWSQAGTNLPLYLSEFNTIAKPLMGLDEEQK